jgi:predicted TIM-barrel fold metal-dependent hydrolase
MKLAAIDCRPAWSLTVLGICAVIFLSACLIDRFGGAFSKQPEELEQSASEPARKLIERAFDGISPERVVDYHTHMLALGTSVSDAFVNPKMLGGLSIERLKFRVYVSATGVKNLDNADVEYVARLLRLARSAAPRGKFRILAFDKHYNADGSIDLGKTSMYVPNRYVVELANKYPDIFLPVISVHPYRTDALAELEGWAKAGVKYVKWLPNAMGMDPANPAIEPFYRKMKEHQMILLSHAGEEQAVEAEEDQRLGNPLLLRKPLDLGVRVIIAHAASLGACNDLDNGREQKAECFNLFLRMMDDPKYVGLLFGEISAMLQFNRMPDPLLTILKRQDLHPRLINGSDYPLPAINFLIRTRSLARDGFITAEERESLNEIYDYNPLLFDFVLKRTVRHPQTKQRLAASVFMANPGLE